MQQVVSENQADVIRDLCGNKMAVSPDFDEEYKLTQEGKIVASLADKFFIG